MAVARECLLYDRLAEGGVRCRVCRRMCVIPSGSTGFCKARVNRDGKLYSIIYGRVASLAVSPIEKKPMFHFYPGSRWLSLGSFGCNFLCPGCQNADIAHGDPGDSSQDCEYVSPEELAIRALRHKCRGISWTYNEPTVWFEYTLDGAQWAKEKGIATNYVTNGFISVEALDTIGPFLDSFRVDIKAFSVASYRALCNTGDFQGVLHSTLRAREKWGMHVEVVTNVIPEYSDDMGQLRDIARWIATDLGKDTPWHVTRFVPQWNLSSLSPTPVETLEKAREIGFAEGLLFVYLGNLPGHEGENTYCPSCSSLLIKRHGADIVENNLSEGRCPCCGFTVPGRF
jgi:pyruvate formate lyase activating enzyme